MARKPRDGSDHRSVRWQRDAAAPGLKPPERTRLARKWAKQRRTCSYCPALATTVDHVVPLIWGGTNYEGNLTPACRACNGSKGGRLLVEWRTGRSIPRVGVDLPMYRSGRKRRAPVTATQIRLGMCRVCDALTTRKALCSSACAVEANARAVRDRHRLRHGLPVDPNQPTSRWGSREAA